MKIKKLIIPLLASLMLLGLASCGDKEEPLDATAEMHALYGGEGADYVIVYPSDATDSLKSAVSSFSEAIKEKTGNSVTLTTDNTDKTAETDREILIGKTNRAQSETAFSKLEGVGYRLDKIDDKITVVGNNDYLIECALEYLLSTQMVADGKTLSVTSDLAYFGDGSELVKPLIVDGEFKYRVILPDGNQDLYQEYSAFNKNVRELVGIKVPFAYDTSAKKDGEHEILVGRTSRDSGAGAFDDVGFASYRVYTRDGDIVVAAYTNENAALGLNELYYDIHDAAKSSYDGNYWIPSEINLTTDYNTWSLIPELEEATFGGIYDAKDSTYVVRYTDASRSVYNGYLDTLKTSGFTLTKDYEVGDNDYALLSDDDTTTYISYIDNEKEIRVFIERKSTAYPTESLKTSATTYEPTLWQLEVDNYNSKANGGMSYVMRTTDGKFIIIDGGYETGDEADRIYNHLKSKTEGNEKPVIQAWYITHLHDDHYGAFLAFAKKYASAVDLKGVYYNVPATGEVYYGIKGQIDSAAAKFDGATVYGKIHTGMTMEFSGFDVTVVCTHEDLYPLKAIDGNDTGLILRVTATASNGSTQRIMFLADTRDNECAKMLKFFDKSDLECDIVQLSHHGYEGATLDTYKAIGAHTVLWPMNIVGWQASGYSSVPKEVFKAWYMRDSAGCEGNKWVCTDSSVKKIIIAGDGQTDELVLPYTPSGSKLPDLDALAAEIKSRYQ